MKKNKQLTLILTIFISTFCLSLNVRAAQELTCTYNYIDNYYKIILIQDADGNIKLWTNEKDVTIKESGWIKREEVSGNTIEAITFSDKLNKIKDEYVKDNHLIACPPAASNKKIGKFGHVADKPGKESYTHSPYAGLNENESTTSSNTKPSEKEVKVAKALTCIYKGIGSNTYPKVVLIQYENGIKKIYINSSGNVTIDDSGWEIITPTINYTKKAQENYFANNSKYLEQCPGAVKTNLLNTKDTITFGDKESKGVQKEYHGLEKEMDYIKEPTMNGSDTPSDGDFKNKKCEDLKPEDIWMKTNGGDLYCLYCSNSGEGARVFQLTASIDVEKGLATNLKFIGYNELAKYFNEYNVSADSGVIQSYRKANKSNNCPVSASIKAVNSYKNGEQKVRFEGNSLGGGVFNLIGQKVDESSKLQVEPYEQIIKISPKDELKSCEEVFEGEGGQGILDLLILLRKVLQVSIPILIIALGSVDLARAIISTEEDQMKKAQKKFISRLILGIGFFLIPSILKLLLTIASQIWPVISADLCGII